ncbi:hypothetical protein [Hymenobacter rubripertinctus]|uniref:Histidine kinase n=1 Tax=Hymenobacter rubripertinctus TaxID=2029981 RepID=A0A418QQW2_9BACT|nr:hypothetical protein [Hymenobacter rubripertinctus]RIY07502.1 hypothetical protein D0T11_16295 [Hymenobacter rubripertinctus]
MPAFVAARHSFRLLFLLLLFSYAPKLHAGGPRRFALPAGQSPVAVLTAGRQTYLVTEQGVFQCRGRQLVPRYQSAVPIRCALATDSVLWLGTDQGLRGLNPRTGRSRPALLPAPIAQAPITTLFQGPDGALWTGVPGYGAYRQPAGGAWEAALSIPTVNAGLSTVADSAVWLATNIGLYRQQHGQWTRYNEEGVGNHDIPDNIVERLLPDNAGNLWVLMSEGISVFPGADQEEGAELPTVRFIGRAGNAVYGVAQLPGQGHVFATGMGLLLLPSQSADALASLATPATDRVESPQRLVPLRLARTPATPTLLQVDARRRIWLAGPEALTVWNGKQFRQAVRAAAQ